MEWRLHKFKSARVMSHRASPLGESNPDTAYRQVVVRLESVQSIHRSIPTSKSTKSPIHAAAQLPWVPDAARQRAEKARQGKRKLEDEGEKEKLVAKSDEEFLDNGKPKTVVEYLVLQKRVVRGEEEDWKVWGFTEASTPSVIARDERYWTQMMNVQAGDYA
jgi:protein MBA1